MKIEWDADWGGKASVQPATAVEGCSDFERLAGVSAATCTRTGESTAVWLREAAAPDIAFRYQVDQADQFFRSALLPLTFHYSRNGRFIIVRFTHFSVYCGWQL